MAWKGMRLQRGKAIKAKYSISERRKIVSIDEIVAQLQQIKYDLSVTQTRVGQALEAVAALPRPANSEHVCPTCKRDDFRSAQARDEHIYYHHAGDVPPHFLAAERLAGIPST